MKPPTHPVPSGDRAFGRALRAAIGGDAASVDLVSEFQVHDKAGDAARQTALCAQARTEIDRLIGALARRRPALWVTYHNYYKAPDLLGPAVCAALNLPYVQIEASRARKRLTGPWAAFAARAEAATDAASLVFYLTAHDLITLKRHAPPGQRLVNLPPFLPRQTLPAPADCAAPDRPMLAAGMMRAGDKLASYALIAETLAHLGDSGWRLHIAGDGPARLQVAELMAPFGDRVRFLGQLDAQAMARAYEAAALFFWPGVNEGFGMVYLEAQAAGLPVVAQDRPGVRDVLAPGDYPAPQAGPAALARRIDALLGDAALRRRLGMAARQAISENHLADRARATFWSAVSPLLEARA
ncbi:glycosyltransferase family 4 protein [Sedimentitalea sp. HM32M-2]|uniref:glycosyltransferase family 4 protein n=1 Tax=Sedimentitalea sp. HM32M-2 TaxID=3351566 RepID=UPI0036D35ADA